MLKQLYSDGRDSCSIYCRPLSLRFLTLSTKTISTKWAYVTLSSVTGVSVSNTVQTNKHGCSLVDRSRPPITVDFYRAAWNSDAV